MPKMKPPLAVVSLTLLLAACTAGSAPAGSPGSSGDPSTSPPPGAVDHPTGPNDIVLRLEEGGGFVPVEFVATQAPIFTLYGDGRVVFQQAQEFFPEPGPDGLIRGKQWRTAQLDTGQIEELMTFALGPGGLGAARDNYGNDMVADASTTTFTIEAGGVRKTVAIYALGMEGAPDAQARTTFQKLADRLRDFDEGGTISSDVYTPTSYRAVLIEREGGAGPNVAAWPWPDLTLDDFEQNPNGPGAVQFPNRVLTADEVAALELGDVSGGVQGGVLAGPDGKNYSFILRPLLPEETA
jgi:hypothetical protein